MLTPAKPPRTAGAHRSPRYHCSPGANVPLSLVTTLFFLWGVPNNLNDVLIRQFMKSFCDYPV